MEIATGLPNSRAQRLSIDMLDIDDCRTWFPLRAPVRHVAGLEDEACTP